MSKALGRRAGKTNNHPRSMNAKADLRREVLGAVGADQAVVFDAFAGDGEMWRAVWKHAAGYVGCDLERFADERSAYVADNRRVLRAMDRETLRAFTVFDLDAHGSPWEQAAIVADRRGIEPGERIGMVLTEGSGLNLKLGGLPMALGELAGMRSVVGGAKVQDLIIDRAIHGMCRRFGGAVVRDRWQARGKSGAAVRYIGLVLER